MGLPDNVGLYRHCYKKGKRKLQLSLKVLEIGVDFSLR